MGDATKPWEEIWVDGFKKGIAVNVRYAKPEGQRTGPGGLDETCDAFVKFPNEGQQRLAARAPTMALLILKEFNQGWTSPEAVTELVRAGVLDASQVKAILRRNGCGDSEIADLLKRAGVAP